MVCRCSSGAEHAARAEAAARQNEAYREKAEKEKHAAELKRFAEAEKKRAAMSPDPKDYEVLKAEEVESVDRFHLVMLVRYPSCTACAYEGKKTMVFLGTTAMDALRWKRIDPHFRDPAAAAKVYGMDAPSPAARFPGTDSGWADALAYARGKA